MLLPKEPFVLFQNRQETKDVYLIHLFFPFVSFKGHGILKRHSIKRNLGGAGNHQVIETTQGAEKIEVGMLLIHQSFY